MNTFLLHRKPLGSLWRLATVTVCSLLLSIAVQATDFPVTNTYDAGPGSLRQAITDANSAPAGTHQVVFNVYGEIVLSSSLPAITANGLVIDGQNKITLTTTGGDVGIIFFTINASQVVVRNMSLLNTGAFPILIAPNTTDVTIRNIIANNFTGNYMDNIVYVQGASTNLTISKLTSTSGMQPPSTSSSFGRALYFTNGTQTNLVMDSLYVSTINNNTGTEAIVFRDAAVNGLRITNTSISGFYSAIVLDNTAGAVETATDVLLNKVTVDSLIAGASYGFYSDYVNTSITIKNSVFDLDAPASTDDGNYALYFDNAATSVIIDSITAKGMDDFGARFTGAAATVSITNSSFSCGAAGQSSTQMIRFDNTASGLTIRKVILDADIPGVTDEADYGIYFSGAATDIILDSLTVNEFDGDGINVSGANTNFQLTRSRFTNNLDGIEFYNNVARTNVDVVNCSFRGMTGNRSGIVVNAANAVADIDLTGDTIVNYPSHGIWLYGGSSVSDITISGCVVYNNGGSGIFNDSPDKAIYTNNAVYNNTLPGIDNSAGNGNCGYEGAAYTPTLVLSTSLGGGQYQVQLNMPAICSAGCTVELYANDPAVTATSGQYPVATFTNVLNGASVQTVTYNTGPGATGLGFWTATLTVPSNNCGTSEFSNKLVLGMKGPACINTGILAWYRADMGVNGVNWADVSGNANHLLVSGDPDDTTGLVNFNKAIYYDGNDFHYVPAGASVTNAYTMMGLGKLEGTQNLRVFTSTTGNKFFGWWGGFENGYYNEAWLQNYNAITNNTKLYSIKRANSGSGPWEFKGNGALLNSGASSNNGIWSLGIGGGYYTESSKVFVPEMFVYDHDLLPAEIQRLESYMALKYGITLNNGNTDYIASDGTTLMWSASGNTGFAKRITGIGRDDCTLLHQKQSLSQDTGVITIAVGNAIAVSNAANANTVTNDKSFLFFADNNGSMAFTTPVTGVNVTQRMGRVWKVQKSGNWADQVITLQVQNAGANNYLLISTNPSFATINQELRLDANGRVSLNSGLLTSGSYFTVGAKITGPNNVNSGVALWLRADDGAASGANWSDFSGNGNSAAQATAARQPVVNPTGVNFNPALKFNGASNAMTTPSLFTSSGVSNIAIFAVSGIDVLQNSDLFTEYLASSLLVHAHVPWSDNTVYWDGVTRISAPYGGTVNQPYLWSFTRSLTNIALYKNAKSLNSVNGAYTTVAGNNQPFTIGAATVAGGAYYNGKIAELIVYNNASSMTAVDRQKIQSYLAIKYGLTLDPANSYLASDGSTYWDATAAAGSGHNKHITGIGRDSVTALFQKQSRSVDTGTVTIAIGNSIAASNMANTGTIANDRSFFVFADNGASESYQPPVTGVISKIRMNRVFKVQKTNWTDQVITIKLNGSVRNAYLLISNASANFATIDREIKVNADSTVTFNTNLLPNGAYFTFGKQIMGPGNVTTGIAAWWRADVDASASSWGDYSGNGKTLAQLSIPNQPSVLPVNINYQPSVKFHSTASYSSASLFGTASTDNMAIFSVSAADGVGGNNTGSGLFSEYMSNGERMAAWAPYSNGQVYFYPPLSWGTQSTIPLVAYANPRYNLYGFTKTPSQLNIYFNNTTVGTTNGTFTGINGNNQPFALGVFNAADWFNGRIAEFIVYNNSSAMTATDRQKIQSYLALKYGITLSQASPTDYLASEGTIRMWTAADNTGYAKRITGIGREDTTALYQKQSLSVDTGLVTIAIGNSIAASNAENTGTINNKSFFVFADDGASANFFTPVTGVTGINARMTRIFKADKTNWADQNITLKLKGGNAQTYLLVSADPVFGTGDAKYQFTDSTITLNSSNLPDGAYFTFATTIKGPNRVDAGVVLWLRADDGTASGGAWNDFSGYGISAIQATAASQPGTDAKGLNFNYAFNFNGSSHFLAIPNTSIVNTFAFGNAARSMIGVGSLNTTGDQVLFSYGTNATLQASALRVFNAQPVLEGYSANVDGKAGSFPGNGIPHIETGTYNGTAGTIMLDGTAQATSNQTWNTNNTREAQIGRHTDNGRYWSGKIGEVIVYNRVLSAIELQQVNSYLALKYGITQDSGRVDYLASNGTSYWVNNATYKKRITGIGRDDSTLLNTKQSLSVDTGFVTVALGSGVALTNQLNTNTITNNRSFLVFADNGLSAANLAVQVTGSAHNVTKRMARVWKVQKTNWADQTITFKIQPIGVDNYMLISSDPAFATFTQELPVASDGTVTFPSSLFTATELYFTFGAPVKSPGGVGGHNLWVRGDLGTSSTDDNMLIDRWNDFSALLNHATQPTPANQPYFRNNSKDNMNFNPVVKFNGAGQFMNLDVTKLPLGTSERTLIGVGSLNTTSGSHYLLGYGAAGTNLGSGLMNAAGTGYFVGYANDVTTAAGFLQVNIANELMGTWAGGVNGMANLYSKMAQVGGPLAKPWNTGTSAGATIGRPAWGAAEYWSGPMGDIIVYPFMLNDGQRLKVSTYLAIKYGYAINQTTPNNYLATDSSVIWNATTNSTYKYNIAGIGRDDEEALNQKQSRSINAGTQVIIGLGSIDSVNTANANTFTADKSYLIWGDDSTSLSFRTLLNGYANANARMTRVWKVQETGTVGNVQIAIPATALANPAKSYLVVSTDAVFNGSDAFTQLTPVVINGVNHYTATVDLNNNEYFTFATDLKLPGGVPGTNLWLRADYGTSSTTDSTLINEWDDFGADVNHATQVTVTSQPLYRNNTKDNANFNAVVDFDGGDRMMANSVWNTSPIRNVAIFAVVNTEATANNAMFSEATSNGSVYAHVPYTDANAYWFAPSGISVATGPWGGSYNTQNLWTFVRSNPNTNSTVMMSLNNNLVATATGAWAIINGNNSPFALGGDAGAPYFNGKIAEMIVYNSDSLTVGNRLKIQSYLGLKYGITLSQATPTNYLATDSSVIWDATVNAAYKYNIAGIGRDDLEGLNQKQSRSRNTGTQVIIGLGSIDSVNTANANSFTADKSYMIWGDDNASMAFRTPVTSANANARMTRVWKVQETGTVGNVQIAIPATALANPAKSYLVVSTDAAFNGSDAFTQLTPVVINGVNHYMATVDLNNNEYFTFATDLKFPGGVVGNTLWLRADYGTGATADSTVINAWDDFGADINHATQATAANQPLYRNNTKDNMNFNAVVTFNGTSQFMSLDITKLPMGTSARSLITVAKPAVATGNRYIFGYGAAAVSQGMGFRSNNSSGDWIGYGDDMTGYSGFWKANTPGELFGTWAGSGGAANLYSSMRSIGTTANKAWNTTGTLASIGTSNWGADYWSGPIGEVIVYPFELNAGQRLKVSTYLAIKYGYTIDQTTPTNYLSTDSSVIWDATVNAAYKYNIAGIGRDDLEGLNQKQSRSINAGNQVIIGLGSVDSVNTANANTFSADKSYLIWGDDSASLSFRTPVTGNANVNMRMARIWKVQETGTVGTVQIAVPAGALANATKAYLVTSTDAVFNGSDVFTPLTPVLILMNGVYYFTVTVDLQNNTYFTFASDLIIPGGVSGANLWVRADRGILTPTDNTAVSGWADYGSDVNHVTQSTAANQPLFRNLATESINFNPVVKFNGSTHYMTSISDLQANAFLANSFFVVSKPENVSGTQDYITAGSATTVMEFRQTNATVEYGEAVGAWTPLSTPGIIARTPLIAGATSTTGTNNTSLYVNGRSGTTGTINLNAPTTAVPIVIGTHPPIGGSGHYYLGALPELIMYDRILRPGEMRKVNSYLAIKYGITMANGDSTYLSADSTIIWDAAANSTFKYSITGIGRDDIEGLIQKQSRNSDTTRLRIAIGLTKVAEDNLSNTGSFGSNLSYLVWGDDNGSASFKTAVTGNPSVNYRMNRVWKVQETGVVGTVEVAIPFDALPNPKQSYLLISADAVFGNFDDAYLPLAQTTINGKRHWSAQVDLNTNQYFTVAAFIKSPGGVGVTSLWMRPDHGIINNIDGQPVDTWVDFGNEANTATQSTTAVQPLFMSNATDNINYNPVVKFNGSTQLMNLDISRLPTGTTARTAIGVGKPNTVSGGQYMLSWGTVANSQAMGLANVNGSGYWIGYNDDLTTAAGFWQVNTPNELFGTWTGNGGVANLYSKITQVATPVNKSWNTGTSSGARIGNSVWSAEYWNGAVSDLIVFDRALSDNERQRVSTYLAIRNGYTIDQATPYSNYLNTNGTVIWNAAANTNYKNNIAGIGRDDIEGLDQKQSKSVQAGGIVAIGLGAIVTDNPSNSNAFSSDTSYLVWGSSSQALTTQATDLPSLFPLRLTQEWKVSLSNFNNGGHPLAMEFDLTGVTHTGSKAGDFTLLIDTDGDGDFTTGAIGRVIAANYSSSKVNFSNVTGLVNGAVFTLAIGEQGLRVTTKAILQGAWNGSSMRTDLKNAGVLPDSDPYGKGATPSVSPNATAQTVVDWVLVELRDPANPATVVASKAAFVLSNGDVVDTNYAQPVIFTGVNAADYKVAIRHRNHLGMMTLNNVSLSTGAATVDFTIAATATHGNHARKDLGSGVMGMWAGNVNGDVSIRHSAKPSDGTAVSNAVLTHPGNTTASPTYTAFNNTYSMYDVNLDARVYSGAAPSDQDMIISNVMTHPANTFKMATYIITEQIP